MDSPIAIDLAKPEDAQTLLEIHAAAVHQTAAPYYAQEILDNWSLRPITSDRIDRVRHRWIESPDRRVMVARQNGQVVGTVMLFPRSIYTSINEVICHSIPSGEDVLHDAHQRLQGPARCHLWDD